MNEEEIVLEKQENKVVNFIKEIYPYVIIVIIVLFVKTYIIAPIQVNGKSMQDTLQNGDIMILNKLQYKRNGVNRFDIVVINNQGTHIIKRVIGLPGDTIEVRDNVLYINGKAQEEDYLEEGTITDDFTLEELFDVTAVPEDHYFALGDNREDSMDSRMIGFIDKDDIEGIATFTVFPFSRFGNKQ